MKKIFLLLAVSASFLFADVNIDKQFYKIKYSSKYKGPLEVSYSLDYKVKEGNIKKRPAFYVEKKLPKKLRVNYGHFANTGTDAGHMASDASFDWSQESLNSTYSMANISPQYPNVNRVVWFAIEELERYNASQFRQLDVINIIDYSKAHLLKKEPLNVTLKKYLKKRKFKSDKHKSNYMKSKRKAAKKLDKMKIYMPSGFYKLMFNKEHGFKECFYVPNKKNLRIKNVNDFKVNCDNIKRLSI